MASELIKLIRADQTQIQSNAQSLTSSLSAISHASNISPAAAAPEAQGESFGNSLVEAIRGVDAQDRLAGEKMADVDSGRSDDLVGAMLSSQQASLSFSMLMQVRNKVMSAMDDLIKLPV